MDTAEFWSMARALIWRHRTVKLKHVSIAMLATRSHLHAGNHGHNHARNHEEGHRGLLAMIEIIGMFFQDGIAG